MYIEISDDYSRLLDEICSHSKYTSETRAAEAAIEVLWVEVVNPSRSDIEARILGSDVQVPASP